MAATRKYDASRRRATAEETRVRIVESAARLFERGGYAGTSVRQVAADAGVAPETVYAAFGSKATLLARAVDLRVEGAGAWGALLEQPWVGEVAREPALDGRLSLLVEHGAAVVGRTAPLLRAVRAAALSDEAVARLLADLEQARDHDAGHLFDLLVADEPLRPEVDRAEARAWFAALTSDVVFLDLVTRQGWTADQHRAWMSRTIRRTLFPD